MIDLYTTRAPHQNQAMAWMMKGIPGPTQVVDYNHPGRGGDICVCWGVRFLHILQAKYETVVVIERGYFNDRMNHYSLGIGGLNGRADFNNLGMPGDRWKKYGTTIKPWKTDGDYFLIMGQVSGDQSIAGINIEAWYQDVFAELARKTSKPVYFRPHPQATPTHKHLPTMRGDLQKALDGAAGVVTFNSNSGVDAVLAGVPTMTADIGAMAWPVADHNIDELLQHDAFIDRTQWARNLAYTQWTAEELQNGTAWAHLVP